MTDQPVGVSPIRNALATLAQLGDPLAGERLAAFRPTGLRPDVTLVAVPPLRLRLGGRPYVATPHPDGRPGYRLDTDRAARFADRTRG